MCIHGYRYASATDYESKLKAEIYRINKRTEITKMYEMFIDHCEKNNINITKTLESYGGM